AGRYVAEDVAPITAMRGVYATPVSDRTYTSSAGLGALLGRVDAEGNGLDGLELTLRSEEHTSELQSRVDLVCRLLLEKKNHNRRPMRGQPACARRSALDDGLRRREPVRQSSARCGPAGVSRRVRRRPGAARSFGRLRG